MARTTELAGVGAGAGAIRRRCVQAGVLTALTSVLLLASAGDALALDSLSVSSSAGPQATVPMTIAAQGSASAPSTLRVFVDSGSDCAEGLGVGSAAAESGHSTATEVITQTPSGSFAYAAAYTPPVAGSYRICAYAYRASAASTNASQVSQSFVAAAAPPPPAVTPPATGPTGGTGATGTPATRRARCVVPKLDGRTYAQARTLIHRAGCIVGRVSKPRASKSRPLHKGGRRRVLRVSHQVTRPGKVLKARGRVSLVLKYVTPRPPKRH